MCLLGTFTHIQRRSGANGFILGVVDGLGRLVCPDLKPGILTDKYTAYFFTILATAGTMIIGSLAMGCKCAESYYMRKKTVGYRIVNSKCTRLRSLRKNV